MSLILPEGWRDVLAAEPTKPYFGELDKFVVEQREHFTVFPAANDVFNALKATPYENVKVLLLGQDPYHGAGQAHGLSFSVQKGVAKPPSLVNMFKELKNDLGCPTPDHGNLMGWAEQGVLLLNAVLTVRQGEANSHKDKGWEKFTDAVIEKLNERETPVVFLLWGSYAQKKVKLITNPQHTILKMVHPSPLSAHNGFFGSKPYSQVNAALQAKGITPIDWCVPNV